MVKTVKSAALEIILGVFCTVAILVFFQLISVQILLGSLDDQIVVPAHAATIIQVKKPAAPTVAAGFPVRIQIPSIHVNAVIDQVGVMANGSMGIPKRPSETAWYKYGPKPGERGSAVIAGHVNWLYGATGVFAHLSSVKPGDKITTIDEKGVKTTFVVTSTRAIGQKEDASGIFLSFDGKAHLNLITCTGVWDAAAHVYSKRLVVFADKVE